MFPKVVCPSCSHSQSAHGSVLYGSVSTCKTCVKDITPKGMRYLHVLRRETDCTMTKKEILQDQPHRFVLGNFNTSRKCLICRLMPEDICHQDAAA